MFGNKKLREKQQSKSPLDEIENIGVKRNKPKANGKPCPKL